MLEFSGKDSYWGNSKGKKKNKTCRLITKSLLGIVLYERLLSLSLSLSLSPGRDGGKGGALQVFLLYVVYQKVKN
jgi:hypothetical protein